MTTPSTAPIRKILVVEDHPIFRAMLVQLINQEPGMAVCGEANNTKDALAIIEQAAPDAAIVDLTLQGPNGLELIKDLKARNLGLSILVVSMHAERLYAERVLRAGAKGFISKEESPSQVLAALRKVMAGGTYLSERMTGLVLEKLGHAQSPAGPLEADVLSDREIEVFQLVGRGFTTREIAGQTRLEPTTVDSYRARIKEKLGIKNSVELYQRAAQWVAERGL